ncbi:MAG: SCO family protein, partial [Gammaproteobacteria bacterium]|nr:SCO family protein [Gammaproteobacteria bacterium]
MHFFTGVLFLTLVALSAFGAEYDRSSALDISQGAIGRQLDNYTLRDTEGQPFAMSELRGKPLVVSMIYTSCHHICPMITSNLRSKIEVAQEALGEDAFSVVTVGFDWRVDTPDRMREFESRLGIDQVPNWHFLATE